jgi:hypothetical protein
VKRNLYYNCCPIAASEEEWDDNIQTLCRYFPVFNGRKIVVVRTGDDMTPPADVEAVFAKHGARGIEFRHRPNDPTLHEAANFIETLEDLQSLDPNEATFYAHTKGVRYTEPSEIKRISIRQWRNRMYYECLHDADHVDATLSRYDAAGCFKLKEPLIQKRSWTAWMFCGTFFWFNHAALFSKDNWRYLGPEVDRFGVENFLGVHIPKERAHSFFENGRVAGALYHGAVARVRCSKCKSIYTARLKDLKKRKSKCCRKRYREPELLSYPELGPEPHRR